VNPAAFTTSHEARFSHEVDTSYDLDAEIVNVVPKFTMQGFPKEDEAKDPSVVIEAAFVLTYQGRGIAALKKENFDCFGEFNGVYNAWPYWREFVQGMVHRMGLPKLVVPVFRITAPPKLSKKSGKPEVQRPSAS
jgi:hypothetical protein